jgi:hypothetical protein
MSHHPLGRGESRPVALHLSEKQRLRGIYNTAVVGRDKLLASGPDPSTDPLGSIAHIAAVTGLNQDDALDFVTRVARGRGETWPDIDWARHLSSDPGSAARLQLRFRRRWGRSQDR